MSGPSRSTPPRRCVRLAVKVVPGAARDEIAGWLGDALKLRVSAPPERGRANAAVVALLARALGLPPASVRIAAGETSARKTVEIEGLAEAELRERLAGDAGEARGPGDRDPTRKRS